MDMDTQTHTVLCANQTPAALASYRKEALRSMNNKLANKKLEVTRLKKYIKAVEKTKTITVIDQILRGVYS